MDHINQPEIRAFLDRHLQPVRLLEVDDHLAVCPACRAAVELEARAGNAVARWQVDFASTEPHLEYPQLLSVAEGQQVPVEVEQHVTRCGSCAYEVQDLRKFVAETAELTRSFRVVPPVRSRARILEWRQRPIWSALAAAVLIGTGIYWYASLHTSQRETTLASLNDGNYQLSLDRSGQLRGAEGLKPDQREALQAVLASGRLAVSRPSIFSKRQKETLLGGPVAAPTLKVLSPLGKVVVGDRPTFTWQPMPTATGYRVRVYGIGYHKIAESPLLHGNEWEATTPLPRGESYTWTVTAESPKGEVRAPVPPQPEATFQVVDAVTARTLEQASSSRGTDHLLLAVLYARAGATDEARAQLGFLAAENPGSKLVDQLKASIDQSAPSPISTNPAQ